MLRRSKLPEAAKGPLIKKYTESAVGAYDRILTQYPLESRVSDAKKRLEAMKQPIPKATPQAIAADKAEIASRSSLGTVGKVMENFHKGPDVSEAAKIGEPTLVDPKQASAPDMVRSANDGVKSVLEGAGGGNRITVEGVKDGTPPPANAPIPRADSGAAAPGNTGAVAVEPGATTSGGASDAAAPSGASAAGDMQNDLAPADSSAPPLPPTQVNDLANSGSSSSTASGTAAAGTSTSSNAWRSRLLR